MLAKNNNLNLDFKNGSGIDLTSQPTEKYSLEENDMLLQIEHVSVDDGGAYSCISSNLVGSGAKNFTLEVLIPPSLDPQSKSHDQNQFEKELIIQYGEVELLKCPVNGNPKPQINWIDGNANKTFVDQPEIVINSTELVKLILNFSME